MTKADLSSVSRPWGDPRENQTRRPMDTCRRSPTHRWTSETHPDVPSLVWRLWEHPKGIRITRTARLRRTHTGNTRVSTCTTTAWVPSRGPSSQSFRLAVDSPRQGSPTTGDYDDGEVNRLMSEPGQSLKDMIRKHERLMDDDEDERRPGDKMTSYSTSTVIRSSAIRRPDGIVSVRKNVVRGELPDSHQPVFFSNVSDSFASNGYWWVHFSEGPRPWKTYITQWWQPMKSFCWPGSKI